MKKDNELELNEETLDTNDVVTGEVLPDTNTLDVSLDETPSQEVNEDSTEDHHEAEMIGDSTDQESDEGEISDAKTETSSDENEDVVDEVVDNESEVETEQKHNRVLELIKTHKKKIILISVSIIAIAAILVFIFILLPIIRYNKGDALFKEGKYALAAEQFEKAGSYEDAESRAILSHKAQSYCDGDAAYSKGEYQKAIDCFSAAGDYKDATDKADLSQKTLHYYTGDEAFKNEEFSKAIEEFKQAGTYEDAETRVVTSTQAMHLKNGNELFDKGKYAEAIEEYTISESYLDADERILSSYYHWGLSLQDSGEYYDAAYKFQLSDGYEDSISKIDECGLALFEQEKYPEARDILYISENPDFSEMRYYSNGMACFDEYSYSAAAYSFSQIRGYKNADEMYNESIYRINLDLLSDNTQESFDKAKEGFESISGYKDSDYYIEVCDLGKAELLYKSGDLYSAKQLYETLPKDLEWRDIKVSDRIDVLNKYKDYVNMTGDWVCESGMMKSKSSAYSSYWYNNKMELWGSDASIRITIDSNERLTLYFEGTIAAYTNFSFYQELMDWQFHKVSKTTIIVPEIDKTSILVDSYTTLSLSGNKIKLDYKKTDSSLYSTETMTTNTTLIRQSEYLAKNGYTT